MHFPDESFCYCLLTWSFTPIENVILDDNQFTGAIPEFTGNKIKVLSLANTMIQVSLDTITTICKQAFLQVLNMKNIKLNSSIPSCLGNNSRLEIIF
jgi:hypothetical protein